MDASTELERLRRENLELRAESAGLRIRNEQLAAALRYAESFLTALDRNAWSAVDAVGKALRPETDRPAPPIAVAPAAADAAPWS